MHAHEKQLRLRIAELRGIDDIAAMLGQKSRYAMHNAALIETRQGKNIFRMRHDYRSIGKALATGGSERSLLSHALAVSNKTGIGAPGNRMTMKWQTQKIAGAYLKRRRYRQIRLTGCAAGYPTLATVNPFGAAAAAVAPTCTSPAN
jgi:hypothetical protein